MSKRLDVLTGVKALVAVALPGATVLGLDGQEAPPDQIPDGGRVIVRTGDPGNPVIDLCPLRYNYDHAIPLEIAAFKSGGLTSEQVLDIMMAAIGTAIEADRFLGGLADWMEATAPLTDDIYTAGAQPPRGADLQIVVSYSTSNPLT